jgi:hypothetical protein
VLYKHPFQYMNPDATYRFMVKGSAMEAMDLVLEFTMATIIIGRKQAIWRYFICKLTVVNSMSKFDPPHVSSHQHCLEYLATLYFQKFVPKLPCRLSKRSPFDGIIYSITSSRDLKTLTVSPMVP